VSRSRSTSNALLVTDGKTKGSMKPVAFVSRSVIVLSSRGQAESHFLHADVLVVNQLCEYEGRRPNTASLAQGAT
jgi:hypothetical protein